MSGGALVYWLDSGTPMETSTALIPAATRRFIISMLSGTVRPSGHHLISADAEQQGKIRADQFTCPLYYLQRET